MKRMIERKTNEGALHSFDGEIFATFVSKFEDAFQEIKKLVNIMQSRIKVFKALRYFGALGLIQYWGPISLYLPLPPSLPSSSDSVMFNLIGV